MHKVEKRRMACGADESDALRCDAKRVLPMVRAQMVALRMKFLSSSRTELGNGNLEKIS